MADLQVFDVDIATEHGMAAAVVYETIKFLVSDCESERGCFDGRVWVRCSLNDLKRQLPFIGMERIRTALGKLEYAGLIKSANYNKNALDRTKWYTFFKKWERGGEQ